MNVYFANGKERHRTIDSSDVQKLAHEWERVSKNVIWEVLIAHFILRQVGVFVIDIIPSVINSPTKKSLIDIVCS